MANKLIDAIKQSVSKLFGTNKQDEQNSAGASQSSAAAASTTPTNNTPQYKNNSVVQVNQPGRGLYQYSSPDRLTTREEVDAQYRYATSLGYSKDQALEQIRNGTRWKEIALGQNNRPIISYRGANYSSREEMDEQFKIASSTGMSKEDILMAMRQGTHWREQTDEDLKQEAIANSFGNAAKDTSGGPLSTTFNRADDRYSTVYSNKKYWDILQAEDYAEKSQPSESKSRWIGGDTRYDYINNIGDARKNVELSVAQMRGDQGLSQYAYMTDDERGIYNYLYATKGKEAANTFLESIEGDLNAQRFSGESNVMNDVATSSTLNGALMSAVTVAGQPIRSAASMAAGVQDFANMLRGKEIDPYSRFRAPSMMTQGMRRSISKKIDEYDAKWNVEIMGQKAGSFAYNTTMSALDSLVNAITGKYLTAALGAGMSGGIVTDVDKYMKAVNAIASFTMSSEVAALTVAESKQKNYSNMGALSLGLLRGAIEYYSEKVGGEWAIGYIKKNPLSFWNSILYSMVPEGVEEVMSDVGNETVNAIIDALFDTEESYWRTALDELKKNGSQNPYADLAWLLLQQEIMSFAGGAFSAIGGGVQHFSNKAAINHTANTLNATPEAVVDLMNEFKTENVTDIDKLANAYDIFDIDALREKVGEVEKISDAINAAMALKNEAAQQQEQQSSVNESTEFEQLHDIAVDNIQSLTDEQLQQYTTLLQQEIKANEEFGSEENRAIADMYRDDLQDAIEEGARRQNAVEQAPSEEYNRTTTTEGEQANGSNQRNGQNDSGLGRQYASYGEQSNVVGYSAKPSVEENAGVRRQITQSEGVRDFKSAEAGRTDTAAQRTGEQGNAGNQTVQRTVSQERTGRVRRIFEAVEKHFHVSDNFLKNPVRYYNNAKNFAMFTAKTLRTVFGSQENASKFVKSWMADDVNDLAMSQVWDIISDSKLTDIQKMTAYQGYCASAIMRDFYDGNFTAQDIADIGGLDLDTAQKILDGAVDTMNRFMADERILNKDGSLKTNPLRRTSMEANRRSGEGKAVSNIATGERVGTAETLDLTEKYVAQSSDKEINTTNKYGNKIYRRADSYLVVNKNGFIVEEVNEGEDVQAAMRHAHMVANKASPSYNIASVRLFGKDMYFDNGDGIFMNQENVFTKENMTSVYGSLASDLMNTAYSDAERGSRKGTTNWFKLNLAVERGDNIGSLTNATKVIRDIIQQSMTVDADGKRGIKMSNGKRYVFFGMTANGAKKGEAIMVDYDYYDKLRTASLSGKKESEVEKFNPAKYLTASASIFSPSNNDLGIKIVEKDPKTGKQVRRVAVIGDLYTVRPDTLRQFMRVDNETDSDALTKAFTDTMNRKLREQGMTDAQIKTEIEKADIPGQVKNIIDHNDVGTIVNIMADIMFQATDGTGLIDIPEGSPYEGQSVQMRSLGGFKAQLVGMKFSDYLHAVIPFNPDAEYLYRGEEGEITGGFRYQNKETGVEVLSYWGMQQEGGPTEDDWIPVKDLRAILFNSTVKFAGQFNSTAEFYERTGDADLRSIPRENVYGASVSDGALEGYQTRGLGQLLRSQFNFTDDEVQSVLGPRLDDIQRSLMTEPKLAAKLFGVDWDGPAPAKSDAKAYAIWQHGPEFFNTRDGKRWLADKMGNIVEDMRKGQFPFKNGEASFGWIDPDTVGMIHAMTAITRINNELVPTEGGGFGLNGFAGLTPGQIFNANLDNANNDNRTVVGRFPSTKAIDVQIRENVNASDPNYKEMIERFGLDKGNTYIAINDTLSMYLDNDYDGDPIITFQGALADLFNKIRSRDTMDENGKPQKKNVLVATAKGLQTQEMEITNAPPVEFSHAKADKVQLGADAILTAVRRYLEVNDSTAKNHKGPRTVGIYDNMVERLAALPDSALKQPAQEAGMSVKEYRALMEARFGVAYVLSIDYAKTGREFSEFFSMIDQLDAMLYDIAEANNLISAREIDKDTGAKITKNDSFVPSWWKNGSGSKREKFQSASKAGSVVNNPNTLLSAMDRLLPTKTNRDGGTSGWTSWFDTFKQKLGYGSGKRLNWAGGMTATPDAYSNLSPEFYAKLSKAYLEVTSSENPEFIALKKRYQEAHRDVKDTDIKNYLIYKHFQQNLGLTNEQFTDLMMMMLSNSNVSSGTILSLDQSKADKNNKQMSTTDIYKRNVRLTKTFEQATRSLVDIDNRINTVGKALINARDSISKLLGNKQTILNAVDAAQVSRIAEMQNHLETGNNSLRQNFNELFKTLRSVQSGARDLTTDDLDAYRNAYENMREEIAGLRNQLNSSESVFASGIAADVNDVFSEVDKEIRGVLRQINTLERSLNELYNTYERQISRTAEAANATSGVFTNATTGLEGLTEQEILDKIGGKNNGNEQTRAQRIGEPADAGQFEAGTEDNGTSSAEERRENRQVQSPGGESRGVRETAPQGRLAGIVGERPQGSITLVDSDAGKLAVDFGASDNDPVSVISERTTGKRTVYTIQNKGSIIPWSKLSKTQRKITALLQKASINLAVAESLYDEYDTNGNKMCVAGGISASLEDENGNRYIFASSDKRSIPHESTHSIIEKLDSKAKQSKLMFTVRDEMIAQGYFTDDQYDACIQAICDAYQNDYVDNYFDNVHEFFAQLFSGDSYYALNSDMAVNAMQRMAQQYARGEATPLDTIFNECLPELSDAEKDDLKAFYLDPFVAGIGKDFNKTSTPTQEEVKPLPFGTNRKSIAKSSTKIQTAIQKAIAGLANSENIPAKKAAADLRSFNTTVKMLLKGKATSEELYVAYNKLKGTLFQDETVDAYFDDFIDINRFVNEDAYNEAVDHALAKFAAHANQVIQAEDSSAKLTRQSVKHNTDGKVKNVTDLFGSWQFNAPTVFKSLMGFKKGTLGYKLADQIQTANKNMQRNYWEAYRHIQDVAKMDGFAEMMQAKPNNKLFISSQITGTPTGISTIEAINLFRMLKSVRYTQGDLRNVKGFTLKDGTRIRTAIGGGKTRVETIDQLYNNFEYYFEHEATAVEKAYYNALDSIFDYFTPEVQRVGKALNGYIESIPADQYSPVYWGKGSVEENFDPKEAQLKVDPRYMKARVEEAGGYLYAAPMNDVMETYIRRMSDYLAFGELREQIRIMNRATDKRSTKTLGQIAGENMGEHYARFVNNYVRDLIHYSENSDSFWYKARMLMQKGTLVGNPSVMMKQSASYLNAASIIDMKYLMRALAPNQFNGDYANGKSGLLEYRRITGNFDPSVTDIFGQKASKNPLVRLFQNGISIIDHATVKKLYVAACLKVQAENPGLNINSRAFEEQVENVFSQAAIETQPQFDPSLRPENARTKNEGVRMLSMFRTQQGQNLNKLYTAIGEYIADKNPESRKVLAGTISGLVGSAFALALFTRVADALLHRKKKYRDEEGEITPESVVNRIVVNSAEALAGTVWFGDDLAKLIIDRLDLVETQEFYGLNMGPVSTVYDAATALGDMLDAYRDGKNMISASKKFIGYVSQAFGYPANNLYNYVNAVTMYYLDHMGDNPDDYDDWTKWMDNHLKAQNRLVRAAEAGNEKKTNRMWEQLQKRYSKPASELNEQLHKDYSRGNVSEDTAINLLITYGGLDDEEAAKKRVAKWEFDKEHPEYKDMSESYVWKWNNTVEPTGVSLQTYYDAVQHFKALSEDKDNGKVNYAMLVYLNGLNLTDAQRSAVWSTFGSNFYSAYDPSSGLYAKFESYAKPAGISAEDFTTYYDTYNSIEADKDRNGKSISGSKKKKVINYINSLPLSKEQKRALWKAFGYTSRSPW